MTVVVWGAQLPIVYLLLERWDTVSLAAARYVMAVPLMLGLLWLREGWPREGPGAPWGRLVLLGIIGIGAISLFHTAGLAYSDPVTAIVVQSASPVVSTGVAWVWLRIRPGPGMGVALALAVAGALLVRLSGGGAGLAAGIRGGELLLLLGSGCWAWYSLACQRWLPGYSQLRITAITFLPGAAFLGVLYAVTAGAGLTRASDAMLLTDALLVVWMAVSATCLGVLLWHFGVSRLGLPMAALYLNGVPVVSLLLTIAFGVVPTWLQLLGALLVVAGVLQAQLRRGVRL